MAIRTKAQFNTLYAAVAGLFADNTTRDISEEDMRDMLTDLKDSVLFLMDDVALFGITDWDMDTNLFPSGSLKGQRYYGIITTSSTLVDVNSDPLPSKIIATSLVNGASTTDPTQWAITYTIN